MRHPTSLLSLAGVTLVWLALVAASPTVNTRIVRVGVEQSPAPPAAPETTRKPEVGIPIPSPVVQKACGPCHTVDEKQQISRISFQRNTPEGWQDTLKRMVALNGLKIDPQTARQVVKYLSDHLGLAPEEARPAAWEVERRLIDYKYTASSDVEGLCNRCHSLGRVISQRRTRSEWDLLVAMHRGWYPLVDRQAFRRMGPAPRERGPDGRLPDTRHPVEKAIDHLSRAFPFRTPEWSAWSASMRPARIDGTWALTGWEPGKGAIYGRVTIAPVPSTRSASSGSMVSGVEPSTTDEFTTDISYTYARSGQTVARTGRVMVYTGYQWRGRSTLARSQGSTVSGVEPSRQGDDDKTALREVMFIERDWRRIEGRWFTGGYDEQGLDVRFDRLGRESSILGLDRTALRTGTSAQSLTIYAANLPATLEARDVDLGQGLRVTRVERPTPDKSTEALAEVDVLTAIVDVDEKALVGPRDLVIAGVAKPAALTVYDKVDSIRVTPSWNMARVGGVTFPKMFAQFEAWGYHNGVDGKPDTPDDLKLDMVNVRWSMEEYTATYADDDMKFVGTLDETTGVFTPNIEGPNPERSGERNNVGDVWVVATYMPEGMSAPPRPPLRARAHLLVTVPLYNRWDPSVEPAAGSGKGGPVTRQDLRDK